MAADMCVRFLWDAASRVWIPISSSDIKTRLSPHHKIFPMLIIIISKSPCPSPPAATDSPYKM